MIDVPGRPVQWQQARISAIVRRTPSVASFFFAASAPFSFRAGQHVDIRLTAPDGYRAQRSYSIASAPSAGGDIELAIEKLPDGEVSPFFHDVAQVGDDIELRGPLGGHFVWSPGQAAPVLLIGGGSGVVPLASMVRERAAARSSAPMTLLYSARTFEDIIFRDELASLAGDGLQFVVTLTRDAESRPGVLHHRRVDAKMIGEALAGLAAPPALVFVCGANAFVGAVADILVEMGISAGIVRTERYGT